MSGSYNNFFKSFNRQSKQELVFECSRDQTRPRQVLRPKRVVVNSTSNLNGPQTNNGGGGGNGPSSPSLNKRNGQQAQNTILNGAKSSTNGNGNNGFRDEVNVEQLDFTKKILHASWHPKDNIVAIAATNNLYLFYNREVSPSATTYSPHSISTSSVSPVESSSASSSGVSSSSKTDDQSSLLSSTSITSSNVNSINNSQITLNTSFYAPSTSSSTTTASTTTMPTANTGPVFAAGSPTSATSLNTNASIVVSTTTASPIPSSSTATTSSMSI